MNRSTQGTLSSIAATALRVCVGTLFVVHGWQRYTQGLPATTQWLETLGVAYATLAAPVLIGAEVLAGIALILGLATRFAALILLLLTGFLWYLGYRDQGFVTADGGTELSLIMAVALAGFALAGSAGTGLDRLITSRRRRRLR